MSPSIVRPAQRHRHSEPMPAPRRSAAPRGRHNGLAVGAVIACLLSGCSAGSTPTAVRPPPTVSPSPSARSSATSSATSLATSLATPSATSEQQRVLAQYQRFWKSLTPISKIPAAQRRFKLAEVAVNPELKSLVEGMSKNDRERQVFYGVQSLHPKPIRVTQDGTTAVVDDCQDSRHTGLADRATMATVTVGVAHNHVVLTMKRTAGDLWKVAFVSYTATRC